MTQFKGLIGLDQLSPEVLTFFQNLISEAIANGGGVYIPPADTIIAEITGTVVTSLRRPAIGEANMWIMPTDGSISDKLVSSAIEYDVNEPDNPSPGDIFVKMENT